MVMSYSAFTETAATQMAELKQSDSNIFKSSQSNVRLKTMKSQRHCCDGFHCVGGPAFGKCNVRTKINLYFNSDCLIALQPYNTNLKNLSAKKQKQTLPIIMMRLSP